MNMQSKAFADLTGVSVRTLRYYDEIGLLKPHSVDERTGYRFYDDASLLRMQEILFLRELDFSLKGIRELLAAPGYDRRAAFLEQKKLLILKKERLERMIAAVDAAMRGDVSMNAFDSREYEQYREEAKERWGGTQAYAEYAEKNKDPAQLAPAVEALEEVFAKVAQCRSRGESPQSRQAQALVRELRDTISRHFYPCTDEILAGLGQMYTADPRFRENIDRHGTGTADYAGEAIGFFCQGGQPV